MKKERQVHMLPKTNSNNCIIIHPIEEKMYSREEVIAICKGLYLDLEGRVPVTSFNNWIKENL